jgi:hypothetical protein
MFAEPAPLAGTPPSASRCAPMLSGRRTHHRCCESHGCAPTTGEPTIHPNRHERVCGPTTLERSDRRRAAYPEMAVCEGEFVATFATILHSKPPHTGCAEPAPLAGRRPPPVAALGCCRATHPPSVLRKREMHAKHWQTHTSPKLTRAGVRADDIGAKRLEEARIPRDGGLRGGALAALTAIWH